MATLHSPILFTLAGIAVFMYGMTLASDNLQKLASNRIRDLIAKLSEKPYWGVAVGVVLTFLIQSSGAVTSMLVGLGTARVVTLTQVMGVILGTAIGTTLTVQLLSLKLAQYGLPIFTAAFFIYFLTNKKGMKRTMAVAMGFGMIFWGLELIGLGTKDLKDLNLFVDSLTYLHEHPFIAILVTGLFTAVVHSSAVTIGFAMTLVGSGLITLTDSFIWVYGANIGTTATALIAATGGNYVGRQVAWAHCFYKVIGVVMAFFFTSYWASFFDDSALVRSVANFHTIFNFAVAMLFYPFIGLGARAIEKLFPPGPKDGAYSVKYLDRSHFHSTSVVLAHAERELLRMADVVRTMIRDSLDLLRDENPELFHSVRDRDNNVDMLNREISLYLTKYMEEQEEEASQGQMIRLISFASDLESAADVIDNNLIDLSRKKHSKKLEFSASGWKDIIRLHREVQQLAELSVSAFQIGDSKLALEVINKKRSIREKEKQMRESHIDRLVRGQRESINTSSIHLDVLSEYRRISGLISNHAYSLISEADRYQPVHREEVE